MRKGFTRINFNKNLSGFTLAEVLVVISVLSILGVIVLTIFSRSLRGTNKSQILVSLKENGQGVLETLTNAIRNADNIVCVSNEISDASGRSLVIVKSGAYSRYKFVLQTNSLNGFVREDKPAPSAEEKDPKVFINRVCSTSDPPAPDFITLTDNSLQKGVSLTEGFFERNKLAGFKDSVKITFRLSPAVELLPAVAATVDPVTFETTIQLR